ncbi:MAG: ribosome assembly RNA-binding protein YhbY [Gemmatimonadota bacterium]
MQFSRPVLDPEANIEPLTSKQRAFLRKEAHDLKPVLQIGKAGVSEAAITAVAEALSTRELIKVKVLDPSPVSAGAAAGDLTEALGDTHLVQTIGRTIVLYRPDPDAPQIVLPG